MKKKLYTYFVFLIALIISGCSKPSLSYFLNKGDTFENASIKLSLNEVCINGNQVSFELQYIKYKSILPNVSISNIDFTYGESAFDYMQLSEYESDEIYFTSIDGVKTDLSTFDFIANQTYTIVLTIDYEYFLNDQVTSEVETGIDFSSIVIYLDVSTYHLRLRSQK